MIVVNNQPLTSLLLFNANIITLDPHYPRANWVAAENGRIIALGDRKNPLPHMHKGTKIIDCQRKTILPGFIDPHIHFASFAESIVAVNVGPENKVESINDLLSKIKTYSQGLTKECWIRAKGYSEFHLKEKRHPDRWDLDNATSEHPIKLTHRSGHAHVLNSLSLKLVGISKNTPDPPGGIIERNLSDGEPTGLLYEMDDFLSNRIPPLDSKVFGHGLRMANRQLLSMGITTIQDASSRNNWNQWKFFRACLDNGILETRVNMMIGLPTFINTNRWHVPSGAEKKRLQFTTVKIVIDETTGQLHPSQQELNEMVLNVHEAGFQVAIHAIEENAIEAACTAIEYAVKNKSKIDHRHRIEHCSVCPPSLAKRIASSNILVVTQPPFIYYNGERYLNTVPEQQLKYLYPIKTLLHHGVQVAGSSDCPIVPPNPLTAIYAAYTRMDKAGRLVSVNEKIPLLDALCLHTKNAAHAIFEEGIKGTITKGKMADLVVIDADPTLLTPDEIKDLNVDMTIIDGEVVWQR